MSFSRAKKYARAPFSLAWQCTSAAFKACMVADDDLGNVVRCFCCFTPVYALVGAPTLLIATVASPFGFFVGACHDAVRGCKSEADQLEADIESQAIFNK